MPAHELFLLLSDQTRLRCLALLNVEAELCVCELCHILESIQPKVSRHLSLLRKSKVVLDERRGKWVYYKLNADIDLKNCSILSGILDGLQDCEPFNSDHKKLIKYRQGSCC